MKTDWKPIKSAPVGVTRLLGQYGKRVTIIGWSDRWERWTDLGPDADHNKQPDYWASMPAPR